MGAEPAAPDIIVEVLPGNVLRICCGEGNCRTFLIPAGEPAPGPGQGPNSDPSKIFPKGARVFEAVGIAGVKELAINLTLDPPDLTGDRRAPILISASQVDMIDLSDLYELDDLAKSSGRSVTLRILGPSVIGQQDGDL